MINSLATLSLKTTLFAAGIVGKDSKGRNF